MRRSEVGSALGQLALALVDETEEEADLREAADLARGFLEIAVEEDRAPVHERAALGRARALAGDAAGGEAILSEALRDAPMDARVLTDAGEAALAMHSTRRSRASAVRSRTTSARPAAWYGLGRALARADRADAAREAFEHARGLGWSAALDLDLGRLHVAAHRVPEAKALLQPLAQDPHGGRSRSRRARC
jgi:hypothetical protein